LKYKDTIVITVLSGFMATSAQELFSMFLKWLGYATVTPIHYATSLLTGSDKVSRGTLWIGVLGHFVASFIFALTLVYLMRKLGKDYYLLKGIVFGAFGWLVNYALIPNLAHRTIGLYATVPTAFADLAAYILWGLIAAFIIARYGDLSQKIQ
jgi:uncharacterized membrane protein YagU involved in acid resistance